MQGIMSLSYVTKTNVHKLKAKDGCRHWTLNLHLSLSKSPLDIRLALSCFPHVVNTMQSTRCEYLGTSTALNF